MRNSVDNIWLAFQDTGDPMGYLLYRAAEEAEGERRGRKIAKDTKSPKRPKA